MKNKQRFRLLFDLRAEAFTELPDCRGIIYWLPRDRVCALSSSPHPSSHQAASSFRCSDEKLMLIRALTVVASPRRANAWATEPFSPDAAIAVAAWHLGIAFMRLLPFIFSAWWRSLGKRGERKPATGTYGRLPLTLSRDSSITTTGAVFSDCRLAWLSNCISSFSLSLSVWLCLEFSDCKSVNLAPEETRKWGWCESSPRRIKLVEKANTNFSCF